MQKIIITLLALIGLCSCRVNNGDIGHFFGAWHLDSMTVDGVTPSDFDAEGSTFWEFQNNIIDVSLVDRYYHKINRWGTWTEADGFLSLDFRHSQTDVAPGTALYEAPEWLLMEPNTVTRMKIDALTAKEMSLTWTTSDGRVVKYHLRKIR